ncbi:MAG: YbaY family lipoprotein [SAR202 cluster bacterium]|nr:YbaY family lipoprotein [SAR202 cluster bacterium]
MAIGRVTGTVSYLQRIALGPDSVIEIKLVDVSRADAPAVTLGELTITNPGQAPIPFEIRYDPADIDDRFTYAVQARITEGGELRFITTTRYQVITRESPTHVDLVLDMVDSSVPVASETPTVAGPGTVEVPAPIETVEVVVSGSDPAEYSLHIVSGLPSGCAEFDGYQVSRDGNTIEVTVTNLMPADPKTICTMIYGYHEGDVALGGDFVGGETYTVVVNGEAAGSFVARDQRTSGWVVEDSPIEAAEVVVSEAAPYEYTLKIVSRLPLGSSCSKFNGYDLVRRTAGTIEVKLTHLEIAPGQVVPCTADLPVVSTVIPLGGDFTPGETYTVVVNGQATNAFVGRDPEGPETVVAQSPIESVELLVMESFPPQYALTVASRLPLGSKCSSFDGYTVTRPFAGQIIVKVTHLEVVDKNVPCTRDLPVVVTRISLGTEFTSGETYTITVNDEVTETFVAQ